MLSEFAMPVNYRIQLHINNILIDSKFRILTKLFANKNRYSIEAH